MTKGKNSCAVGIIGGADGPTSVYIGREKRKIPVKYRIRNQIYRWKTKCAAKKITAGERILTEVIAYAEERYGAVEADITERKYAEQKRCLKRSLIYRHKPDLLNGGVSVSEMELPMDFHVYEIVVDDGTLEMEVDYYWEIFGVSFSGNRRGMKKMNRIQKDLYLYYGVSQEDIRQKSERYHSLLAALSK
jgi:hypothetical protein